jgi:hypothetical protein
MSEPPRPQSIGAAGACRASMLQVPFDEPGCHSSHRTESDQAKPGPAGTGRPNQHQGALSDDHCTRGPRAPAKAVLRQRRTSTRGTVPSTSALASLRHGNRVGRTAHQRHLCSRFRLLLDTQGAWDRCARAARTRHRWPRCETAAPAVIWTVRFVGAPMAATRACYHRTSPTPRRCIEAIHRDALVTRKPRITRCDDVDDSSAPPTSAAGAAMTTSATGDSTRACGPALQLRSIAPA